VNTDENTDHDENGQMTIHCAGCGRVMHASQAPLCDECIDKGE